MPFDEKPLGLGAGSGGEVEAVDKEAVGAAHAPTGGIPDFCHKCGRCCKSATTYASHEELLKRQAEGDEEASEFLRVFQPYHSIEDARKAVPDQVDRVVSEFKTRTDLDDSHLTFYHCRYVTPEGLCGIYQERPRCCREAPANGWSIMPPGCGYEGWQFAEREAQKQTVRQLKNSVYALEQLSEDGVSHPLDPNRKLADIRAQIEEKIKPWQQFGSAYW